MKPRKTQDYDRENLVPLVRASVCTGEKLAGFMNLKTKKFTDVMLIRSEKDLEEFRARYGITGEIKTQW